LKKYRTLEKGKQRCRFAVSSFIIALPTESGDLHRLFTRFVSQEPQVPPAALSFVSPGFDACPGFDAEDTEVCRTFPEEIALYRRKEDV